MFSKTIVIFLQVLCIGSHYAYVQIPYLKLSKHEYIRDGKDSIYNSTKIKFFSLPSLAKDGAARKDFWLKTEVLPLLRAAEQDLDFHTCEERQLPSRPLHFPTSRQVRPVCSSADPTICPLCAHLDNETECELFRDSCKERRVNMSEYGTYCEKKYGKWRTMLVPADYKQCRCCDECIFYRELDQSCVQDEFQFDSPETLPVTTVDFRAGCNPYLGHPDHEIKSLRCDENLRRCRPTIQRHVQKEPIPRNVYRFKPTTKLNCPAHCRNFRCPRSLVPESKCPPGSFMPEWRQCNCCGRCSRYLLIHQKCAQYNTQKLVVNGTDRIEIEGELPEPGCDDGLVCREGTCQDIHKVSPPPGSESRIREEEPYEPCKEELQIFKKKFGVNGHLHYNAPQCTPLWLYAPIQCRGFVCHCALEDGTIIGGTKTPRVEVSNMNCDCAREKCRSGSKLHCDGYGNYKVAVFNMDPVDWSRYLSKAFDYYASFATERNSTVVTEHIKLKNQNEEDDGTPSEDTLEI